MIGFKEIEKKGLDSIKMEIMEGQTISGKAKSFPRKKIYAKIAELFERAINEKPND